MQKIKLSIFIAAIFILGILSLPLSVQAERFFFNFKEGQRFTITSWTTEDIYKNDLFIKKSKSKTIGNLEIVKIKGNKAFHRGVYKEFSFDESTGSYYQTGEYPTEFYRDKYGHYEIDRNFFMPVVRNVPVFPAEEIKVGEQWTERAYEVHDFRKVYGISNPVIFPAAAAYQYLGTEKMEGKNLSKFSINYVVNYTMKYNLERTSIPLPYRIIGYFNQLFLWNKDINLPDSYKENFDFIMIMTNGDVIEYIGKSRGTVTVETPIQDVELSHIKDRLKKLPYANVTRSKEGIVINIGEILFKFDSDEFVSNADETLDNIVEVLKDYPDRRIRVVGHTDSTGPENYNLSLSLRRAKRVATELIKRLPELKGKISYIGLGEKMPIASNATEEGRKLNRRVEIIILNYNPSEQK